MAKSYYSIRTLENIELWPKFELFEVKVPINFLRTWGFSAPGDPRYTLNFAEDHLSWSVEILSSAKGDRMADCPTGLVATDGVWQRQSQSRSRFPALRTIPSWPTPAIAQFACDPRYIKFSAPRCCLFFFFFFYR